MRRLRSHAPHLRSLTLGGGCPVTVEGLQELRFMHLTSLQLLHLPGANIGQQVRAALKLALGTLRWDYLLDVR